MFRWLYDRLRRLLDRWIFKDSYDYRSSLQRLSQDLSLAGHLDTLGATLRRLMNLDFAVLLVRALSAPPAPTRGPCYPRSLRPRARPLTRRGSRPSPMATFTVLLV
ncbi:MAG: hypothetical protein LC769_10960, partial [Chloroflexi bacterium]|nr:hypothetical protein [Chloroflexota bacterium]